MALDPSNSSNLEQLALKGLTILTSLKKILDILDAISQSAKTSLKLCDLLVRKWIVL